MTRICTVCTHPHRSEIDAALIAEQPNRRIAAQFTLSEPAVRRHKDGHLLATLARAADAAELADAESLLAQVAHLHRRTLAILTKAEGDGGNPRTALSAIREARGNLELLARLLGKLQDAPTVNVLVAPEWMTLRGVILDALTPYPAARLAVAEALQRVS